VADKALDDRLQDDHRLRIADQGRYSEADSDAPGEEEIAGARKILNWTSPPFVIPEPLLREWREIGAKGREARMAWADRVKAAPAELRSEFERRNDGKLPPDWKKAIAAACAEFIASGGRTALMLQKISSSINRKQESELMRTRLLPFLELRRRAVPPLFLLWVSLPRLVGLLRRFPVCLLARVV
jgi:hypothetical protein